LSLTRAGRDSGLPPLPLLASMTARGEEPEPQCGQPLDLPYLMGVCLCWRPPPHLDAVVAWERESSRAA